MTSPARDIQRSLRKIEEGRPSALRHVTPPLRKHIHRQRSRGRPRVDAADGLEEQVPAVGVLAEYLARGVVPQSVRNGAFNDDLEPMGETFGPTPRLHAARLESGRPGFVTLLRSHFVRASWRAVRDSGLRHAPVARAGETERALRQVDQQGTFSSRLGLSGGGADSHLQCMRRRSSGDS